MPKLKALERVATQGTHSMPPCTVACPVNTNARDYVLLTGEGRFDEAFLAARGPNPFPSVCGRACSAPCEDVCTRGEFDRPVRIRQLKRFLSDRFVAREVALQPAAPTGLRVAVVGAGPAGLTAALYAARANLEPLVFQGSTPGGQLITTTDVENFPGFPDGILGPELMQKFEAQAARFGAELRYGSVTAVDFGQRPFRLVVDEETPVLADAVIISTGASAKYLGLPNEQRLLGYGVSACATCDGAFFRGEDVAIVGGGDTALEEALFLTRFARRVYLIHRRSELRASKIMQERAFKNDKITFVWDTVVTDVLGEKAVEGLALENAETGERSTLAVQGFFVAIGHQPNTDIFRGWLDMDAQGYLVTKPDSTHTNVEGVFACGDAQDRVYRQAVTAAGTGCMAAIDAERWLAEHGFIDEPRTETEYHAAAAVDSASGAVVQPGS